MTVLAALGLHDADDLELAVDVASLEAASFARAQSAAIAEREHHLDLEAGGHGQQALGLGWAHDQRKLLRLPT